MPKGTKKATKFRYATKFNDLFGVNSRNMRKYFHRTTILNILPEIENISDYDINEECEQLINDCEQISKKISSSSDVEDKHNITRLKIIVANTKNDLQRKNEIAKNNYNLEHVKAYNKNANEYNKCLKVCQKLANNNDNKYALQIYDTLTDNKTQLTDIYLKYYVLSDNKNKIAKYIDVVDDIKQYYQLK